MRHMVERLLSRTRGRPTRTTALVAAAATVLLMAACGSSTASSSASHGATSGHAPNGIVGHTLTMQFDAPVSLNPALEGTFESDIDFGALEYDSLIYQLGNGSYVPDLATSWSYVAGSHNEVFNLTLRSGVRFSDGSLMTPSSVVASLDYFKAANGPQASYLANLTAVTATGPDTVEMKFSAPEPDLPFLLSQYQDIGQIIGPVGVADPAALATSSDGAGPYVLDEAQSVTNSQYTFTVNPHYWDPAAIHYRTVVVKVITDPQTALAAAQSGQVNALTDLPPTVAKVAAADGLRVYSEPFSIASLVFMDRSGTSSPLGNLKVRQAINDAIDRPALARGLGGPSAVPTDEFTIPGTPGYDPSQANYYPYDVTQAKRLLTEAGYPHGFSLSVLDTLALDPNGDIGAALKTELAAIGVNLNLTEVPSPAQFIPAALSKHYPAVIWPISQNGAGFPYAVQFALAPFTNAFGTTSSQLNQLMVTAGQASTTSAASAAYEKVNDFLVDNAWFAPLFSLEAVMAVNKDVANVQAPSLLNSTIDPVAPEASLSWYPASS